MTGIVRSFLEIWIRISPVFFSIFTNIGFMRLYINSIVEWLRFAPRNFRWIVLQICGSHALSFTKFQADLVRDLGHRSALGLLFDRIRIWLIQIILGRFLPWPKRLLFKCKLFIYNHFPSFIFRFLGVIKVILGLYLGFFGRLRLYLE